MQNSKMENQGNPILKFRQPLSMLVVIKKTMNTIVRNRRPLQVILCLVILTSIQFQVAISNDLETLPTGFSFQITYGRGSEGLNMRKDVTRDVHEQLETNIHIVFTYCCMLWYCAIVTISCSCAGNTLSIMEAFFKPSRNWKRPLHTTGCLLLLTLGIYVVYILSFAAISSMAGTSHADSLSLFYVATLKWIFNAHVNALWMMSLVVTVLEDNISGLKAINRAVDIMKGNRVQITLLMMLHYGGRLLIRKMFDAFFHIYEEWLFEEVWALRIPFVTGFYVFLFVLFTVLYHECKTDNKVDSVSDKAS